MARASQPPRNFSTAALNSAGFCSMAKWLTPGRIRSCAPGTALANISVWSRRIASSCSPSTISTGALDVGREGGVLEDVRLQPGDGRVGGEREQPAEPVGMVHGDVEPDDRPVAPADDVGLGE